MNRQQPSQLDYRSPQPSEQQLRVYMMAHTKSNPRNKQDPATRTKVARWKEELSQSIDKRQPVHQSQMMSQNKNNEDTQTKLNQIKSLQNLVEDELSFQSQTDRDSLKFRQKCRVTSFKVSSALIDVKLQNQKSQNSSMFSYNEQRSLSKYDDIVDLKINQQQRKRGPSHLTQPAEDFQYQFEKQGNNIQNTIKILNDKVSQLEQENKIQKGKINKIQQNESQIFLNQWEQKIKQKEEDQIKELIAKVHNLERENRAQKEYLSKLTETINTKGSPLSVRDFSPPSNFREQIIPTQKAIKTQEDGVGTTNDYLLSTQPYRTETKNDIYSDMVPMSSLETSMNRGTLEINPKNMENQSIGRPSLEYNQRPNNPYYCPEIDLLVGQRKPRSRSPSIEKTEIKNQLRASLNSSPPSRGTFTMNSEQASPETLQILTKDQAVQKYETKDMQIQSQLTDEEEEEELQQEQLEQEKNQEYESPPRNIDEETQDTQFLRPESEIKGSPQRDSFLTRRQLEKQERSPGELSYSTNRQKQLVEELRNEIHDQFDKSKVKEDYERRQNYLIERCEKLKLNIIGEEQDQQDSHHSKEEDEIRETLQEDAHSENDHDEDYHDQEIIQVSNNLHEEEKLEDDDESEQNESPIIQYNDEFQNNNMSNTLQSQEEMLYIGANGQSQFMSIDQHTEQDINAALESSQYANRERISVYQRKNKNNKTDAENSTVNSYANFKEGIRRMYFWFMRVHFNQINRHTQTQGAKLIHLVFTQIHFDRIRQYALVQARLKRIIGKMVKKDWTSHASKAFRTLNEHCKEHRIREQKVNLATKIIFILMSRKVKAIYINTLSTINKCSKKALRQRQVTLALTQGAPSIGGPVSTTRRSTVSMVNPNQFALSIQQTQNNTNIQSLNMNTLNQQNAQIQRRSTMLLTPQPPANFDSLAGTFTERKSSINQKGQPLSPVGEPFQQARSGQSSSAMTPTNQKESRFCPPVGNDTLTSLPIFNSNEEEKQYQDISQVYVEEDMKLYLPQVNISQTSIARTPIQKNKALNQYSTKPSVAKTNQITTKPSLTSRNPMGIQNNKIGTSSIGRSITSKAVNQVSTPGASSKPVATKTLFRSPTLTQGVGKTNTTTSFKPLTTATKKAPTPSVNAAINASKLATEKLKRMQTQNLSNSNILNSSSVSQSQIIPPSTPSVSGRNNTTGTFKKTLGTTALNRPKNSTSTVVGGSKAIGNSTSTIQAKTPTGSFTSAALAKKPITKTPYAGGTLNTAASTTSIRR